MESCDVLIVGGGPAGSSCAWELRRSGLDVAILDKQVFPRDKVCGGWITPSVFSELEIDPSDYAQGRLLQPITAFRIGCIGGTSVDTEYGKTVSYGIRRCEFDDYLLRRSGARVLPPAALASLERSNDGWIANGGIRSRLIIGAGGHFCPVARLSGARISGAGTSAAGTSAAGTGHETPVVAQETEFAMDARELEECKVRGDMPEVYFCSDMKGYGWCFRKGNMLNIGLGRADPHQLSTHVAGFLRFLRSAGKISFDIRTLRGHAYLLYGTSTREIAGDRLLLIGDAAGLAYPQSGEGILPAIRSGIQAAKSIAGGGFTREQAEAYRVRIASWRQPGVARLIRYLPLQFSSAIARSLLRTRWFTREVVLKNWFLHSSSNGM